MKLDFSREPAFTVGQPTTLPIEGTVHPTSQRNYDVTPDGKQLLVVLPAADPQGDAAKSSAPKLIVVQNWLEELKRRVPVHP